MFNTRHILVVIVLMLGSFTVDAIEVSRNNYVDWVAASSVSSSTSHFVQWKNAVHLDCVTQNSTYRTRFSVDDKALLSLLLTARVANKKVGFYYNLIPSTGTIPGHGTSCQLVNAWLESE